MNCHMPAALALEKACWLNADSIKGNNIFRIYPHTVFCNNYIKNRCVANNKDGLLYYYDSHHPSIHGHKKIEKLILNTLDRIHDNKN
jgi:hypothetical protein